jgi:hypothetical protein
LEKFNSIPFAGSSQHMNLELGGSDFKVATTASTNFAAATHWLAGFLMTNTLCV